MSGIKKKAALLPTDEVVPGSSLWWATRKLPVAQRRRTGGIDRDRIVRAAIELIDREGIDGLSMRQLAAELGTGTATIYRFVPSRRVILVEAMDVVIGDVIATVDLSSAVGWRGEIEASSKGFRAMLLRHPGLVPLFADSNALNGPNGLLGREALLGTLRRGGFDEEIAVAGYLAIVHFIVGFVASEVADLGRQDSPDVSELRTFYQNLDRSDYPATVVLAPWLADRNSTREFDFGLSLILDGLEHLLQ